MLTSGHTHTARRASVLTDEVAEPARAHRGPERPPRLLRLAAATLGLLGALLVAAVPLLPVIQTTSVITWPQQEHLAPVNAPLAIYQPQLLTATIPCAAAESVDARLAMPATVLATTPPNSPKGAAVGMVMQVADGTLTLNSRGQALGSSPLGGTPLRSFPVNTTSASPQPCLIRLTSDATGTTASVGPTQFVNVAQDVRPQVTGIYSDLNETLDPVDGVSVRITPDTRFQSVAHPIKLAAMLGGGLAVLVSLLLAHRLDERIGRRAPRLLPSGWWRPTGRDATVIAVLAVWVVIGGITSDDGYILTMIRTRAEMGYVGNYYRWFNVPEAPFGWPYELYALWSQLNTTPPWLRLPSFAMGVVSWMLISREVMPRLGREVRRSAAAGWAAAAVFLAFWLPYNNGLRLEPVVAIGSLLALCAVERALATSRVMPLALGLIAAAFTVAASPTGFIAVAPFLVALRPILRLVRRHAAMSGWSAVLGPILGAGLLVLAVIFADQTLRGVLEATAIRTQIGPSLSWFQEPARYQALFSDVPDGALTRRFPVLLLLLCLGTCLVVLLRRGNIPGAGLGPSRRLIGASAVSLALLALTPTKWTHHFGAFASIGAALAALTALATSASVLRSARNRWWFLSGLLLVLALAMTGPNAPWYVSQYGVPWFDKPPSINGLRVSTLLIALAALAALIAMIKGLRHDPGAPPSPPAVSDLPTQPADRQGGRRRALLIGSAPLAVICGLLVLGEVVVMVKAVYKQRDGYSMGAANIAHITSTSCNLTDAVAVEPNRRAGALTPVPGTLLADIPLRKGFEYNRLPPAPPSDTQPQAQDADVTGDRAPRTDSEDANPIGPPPPGLGGSEIPIWSSFNSDGPGTGGVRTGWYALPDSARAGRAPVVVSVEGTLSPTTPLLAEFGRRTGKGFQVVDQIGIGGSATAQGPGWRDYRLGLAGRPAATADTVRLIATDADVTPDGWLAFSAPRVPRLTPMTGLVTPTVPVFLDWPVGFVHPCVRPFAIRNGIAEMPRYRLLPDEMLANYSKNWSSNDAGGPLGWLQIAATEQEEPTYLKDNWDTDWGKLTVVEPRVQGAVPPTVQTSVVVRSGWWSPGPLRSGGQPAEISQLGR